MSYNSNIIVSKSLEYYDKNLELNNKKYFNKINNIKFIKSNSNNDMEKNKIEFYYNKKKLYSFKYEEIGSYYNKSKLWVWAWADPKLKKKENYISRKILNYGLDLDTNQQFLKTELITSRFIVNNLLQLDIHVSLASYLTKIPNIYCHKVTLNKKNKEDYILLYLFLFDK